MAQQQDAQQQQQQDAPRKTTTYKNFTGMNSQDQRFGVERDEFFLMENIMRVADGRLHSVPGPSVAVWDFNNLDFFLELESGFFVLLEDGGEIILNG